MTYKARIVDKLLQGQLACMGTVLVEGTKWCGKTAKDCMKKILLTALCCFGLASLSMTAYAQRPQSGPHSHHAEAPAQPRSHHHHHHHPAEEKAEVIYTASEEQVEAILTYLKSLNFESDRAKAAQLCVTICPVAADDIARMVQCFSFEEEKKKFAIYAFDYCPDPENYAVIINQFTFDRTKLEVAKAIVESFPMYAREIAGITRVFSFDSDRLTIAKAAYPSCLDKWEYDKVIVTFSFASNQNQLRNFMQQEDEKAKREDGHGQE